ncbi:type I polyketide synthase [Kutzneria kofuensis]
MLAGRCAFRRLPDERMNHADYYSADPAAPDRFYSRNAAVLRDFEFDRVRYHIAGSTYRSTDLTHWLALDVAAAALADAGFPDGVGLPGRGTGVVIGNSLTGEFSRANNLRLRWPYVRRVVAAELAGRGWSTEDTGSLLRDMESRFKAPFPAVDEDTLAGALSNTIAGRICNYFDFGGGGYTVDGACSSSLLSVATAANALAQGDLDVALAGGVDLSIDPLEVIGFAKTGALATGRMKVYDRDSNGFWPGEGAGMLVLMRERDALAAGRRMYAVITGWGVSSDGRGGITRPEAAGHRLALERAYHRAGYGIQTVSYFEGHGTGTAVGDPTEIEALSSARRAADPSAPPAALGTVKGNFGHTKAAAGVAGLIKATLAVHHQVIPPATSHFDPHPVLGKEAAAVYVPTRAEPWPAGVALRAGVSAMGFGGINTHVAVQQAPGVLRRTALDERTTQLVAGRQDAEVLLLDATDRAALRERVDGLLGFVGRLAFAELTDLAGQLAGELSGGPLRAAVVATDPEHAERGLARLREHLDDPQAEVFAPDEGVFLSAAPTPPRIAYLFPGQGSGRGGAGALRDRFPAAEEILSTVRPGADQVATEVAQPRIVSGSLAGLRVLRDLGLTADTAVGHSLGELTALHWAGALNEAQVLTLAGLRGRVMARDSRAGGTMAGLATGPDRAEQLAEGEPVVIAGYNGPHQTVLSGPADAVDRVCAKASAAGVGSSRLAVSHAFHSPLVEPAATAFAGHLSEVDFATPGGGVYSTVTEKELDPATDLRALLHDQILLPVRFHQAAAAAVAEADLVLEVGPGRVLTGLLKEIAPERRVLPLDTDHASLAPLLRVIGAAFALGAPVRVDALFAGRLLRPLPADGAMKFLTNPCSAAPEFDLAPELLAPAEDDEVAESVAPAGVSTFALLRNLTAERVELPLDTVTEQTLPLDDLHLSSITVGQIVNQVTRELGLPALAATPNFATVSLGELATIIDDLAETAHDTDDSTVVPGVAPWVRPFRVDYVPTPLETVPTSGPPGDWAVHTPADHPVAAPLAEALAAAGIGDGVLLCLPAECTEQHAGLFLDAAHAVLAAPAGTRFVVLQQRFGAAGLAKTLHLESPGTPTTVISVPDVMTIVIPQLVADVAATTAFQEVRYDESGGRTVPALRVQPVADASGTPLTSQDVLLVTGGGKGITAECAFAVARDSGARLALLGRSDPAEDAELAANLARMDAEDVRYRYARADVTDPAQVRAAVDQFRAELGEVTAILHGAGRNEPTALANLTEEAFRAALAPKVGGLRAVLAAVDPDRIRLLITFGSIIGRAGLRGEAHYACANDWLTELATEFQRAHPAARVLALEWSVWSGAGMGERLGVVEALLREGITPISADSGMAVLRRLLADPSTGPVLVVAGRSGDLPSLPLDRPPLPLRRFTDRVLVNYPGVELVCEADLSAGSDPYLSDHQLDGDLVLPAVLGMEAMAQVASAVTGLTGSPVLSDVEFPRPVVVPLTGTTTIRVAALVTGDGVVQVVLRSEETGFSADHFRATLTWPRPEPAGGSTPDRAALPAVPVDPQAELYGEVLFQGKRFQRVVAYRKVSARHAVAELSTQSVAPWFAAFLPQELVLADPGSRDAAMHGLQVCVPDATLLPERVDRLYLAPDTVADRLVLDARERAQDGDRYTYDVDLYDPDGSLVERWVGLVLHAVRKRHGAGPWVPALLGPHLERTLEHKLGGRRAVVVEPDPVDADRRVQTRLAASRAAGAPLRVHYRPDGRPETGRPDLLISSSHGAGLTMVVAGAERLACDVETVVDRTERDWADLLGPDLVAVWDLVRAEAGDSPAVAGTRVWSAMECLRKAGSTTQAVTVRRTDADGWVVLAAGDAAIATWTTTLRDRPEPVVFAVLAGGGG